jgi:hypothetical protein
MKTLIPLMALLVALVATGCSYLHFPKRSKPAPVQPQTIVTPDTSLSARVVSVNTVGRFVVLGFPPGRMPKVDQIFYLYRTGLKVGMVRITGPQTENNIVADLATGDAQAGDDVRDQ